MLHLVLVPKVYLMVPLSPSFSFISEQFLPNQKRRLHWDSIQKKSGLIDPDDSNLVINYYLQLMYWKDENEVKEAMMANHIM